MRPRSSQSMLLLAALGFFGLAGVTQIALEIAVRHQLAQGSSKLGVAVPGMLFGWPMPIRRAVLIYAISWTLLFRVAVGPRFHILSNTCDSPGPAAEKFRPLSKLTP